MLVFRIFMYLSLSYFFIKELVLCFYSRHTEEDISGQYCQLPKGISTEVQLYCQHLHAMIFPYLFFIRFSSFLADSQGADCPSKKL